jgi:early secretory antigenic target protein ESAT-6
MSEIYVEHARIETAATRLRAHKKTFDAVLGQLESDLAPMIATWSGEARDLYLAKKASWDRAALDLTVLLASIATLTEDAHAAYSTTVSELSDMWA